MTKLSKSTIFGIVSILAFSITGIVVLSLHGDDTTTVVAFLLALVPPTIGALVGVRQNDRLLEQQQQIKHNVNGNMSALIALAEKAILNGLVPAPDDAPGKHAAPETPTETGKSDG